MRRWIDTQDSGRLFCCLYLPASPTQETRQRDAATRAHAVVNADESGDGEPSFTQPGAMCPAIQQPLDGDCCVGQATAGDMASGVEFGRDRLKGGSGIPPLADNGDKLGIVFGCFGLGSFGTATPGRASKIAALWPGGPQQDAAALGGLECLLRARSEIT